jgi:hypothetical protein
VIGSSREGDTSGIEGIEKVSGSNEIIEEDHSLFFAHPSRCYFLLK